MAAHQPLAAVKTIRNVSSKQRPHAPPEKNREMKLVSGKSHVPLITADIFDPYFVLRKLPAEKTSREYYAGESIFLQGDPADAVFYIQSGKVKLTVVSKRGKEAVVAILPDNSFLGEGCLAGQPAMPRGNIICPTS